MVQIQLLHHIIQPLVVSTVQMVQQLICGQRIKIRLITVIIQQTLERGKILIRLMTLIGGQLELVVGQIIVIQIHSTEYSTWERNK